MTDPHDLPDDIDDWPDGPLWKAYLERLVRDKPLFGEIEESLASADQGMTELIRDLKQRYFFIQWDDPTWLSQVARYLHVLQRTGRVVRWGPIYRLVVKSGRGVATGDVPFEGEEGLEALNKLLEFEGRLRRYIERRLRQGYGEKWWEDGVPTSARDNAARNRASRPEEERGADSRNTKFLSWSDYATIILNKRNWKKLFEADFRDHETAAVYLKELTDARNALVHLRGPDPALISAIPFFISRLEDLIA